MQETTRKRLFASAKKSIQNVFSVKKNPISLKDVFQIFNSNNVRHLASKFVRRLPIMRKPLFENPKRVKNTLIQYFFSDQKNSMAQKLRHGSLKPMMLDTWFERHWSDL